MALIEAERTARGSGGQETALRDWVRALEATAPIPVQRQRTLHSSSPSSRKRRATLLRFSRLEKA